jgi:hypothetical protein
MSNHNLFIHGADGASEPASTEQILAAARQALWHTACAVAHRWTRRRRFAIT